MIQEISIADVATFDPRRPESLCDLSQFNYLYGSNGTGKTTISRIIANEEKFPGCKVKWKNCTRLQPMVYNRDFVERNFDQPAELKGVFTLGEENIETLDRLKEVKKEWDRLTEEIEELNQILEGEDGSGGKKAELHDLEKTFEDKCWVQKKRYDTIFKEAFKRYRRSKEDFKKKIVLESISNRAPLLVLPELKQKAESIFVDQSPTAEKSIPDVDAKEIIAYESNPILKKKVIGKEDVDIAGMIQRLDNSDWVRKGQEFYDLNEGVCPFCQQSTSEKFAQSLSDYFDETYEADCKEIKALTRNYEISATRLQKQIISIIETPSRFLELKNLEAAKDILDSKITINLQILAGKEEEATRVVELESIINAVNSIRSLIESANEQIEEYNDVVENLSQERSELTKQVWKFVLEELKSDLKSYRDHHDRLSKDIKLLIEQIKEKKKDKGKKENEINELKKKITSVQPTISEINRILSSFGFQGFSLAKANSDDNSYKLVRTNGSDAKDTLSEGERNFVAFLYFYHLLKGGHLESDILKPRIAVFDDPVSSLDSEIMFIVASLIRGLFDEVRKKTGPIKQIFILTHNVYFHKEITFNQKRRGNAMQEEKFWIVRKTAQKTKIEKHDSNPIKTLYELLWCEVRNHNQSTSQTIQNTLRRILEYYFKILGGINWDDIIAKFEGEKKMICISLFSWLNDGSHSAYDDMYVATDDSTVANYLNVFREVFEKTDHLKHYEMMMRYDPSER